MLTKTDFQLFRECHMHLWAIKHDQFTDRTSDFDKHLIQQGYEIEALAIKFLRNTLESDSKKLLTQQTYTDGSFEARVDALIHDQSTDTYELYEIKSSTSDKENEERKSKEDHVFDATFQALVLEKKIDLQHVYLVTVNKSYTHQGEIDLAQFFAITCIDQEVAMIHDKVRELRDRAFQNSEQDAPTKLEECTNPKTCPCVALCHPNIPEDSIYDISGLWGSVKKELRSKGILKIKDIPEDFPLWDKQRKQVQVVKSGKPVINKDAIRHELEQLIGPLSFLDYETFNTGIPLYDGYHPYQHMIFQYSLHVVDKPDKEPKHYEFLVDHAGDPSREVCEHLLQDLPKTGTVISWNKSFEMGCNTHMAEMYPEYSKFLLDMNERMYDLGDVFKNNDMYVLPEFKGSWSIKNVLPVLVPELSYKGLAIGKGDAAMKAWWELVGNGVSEARKEEIVRDLLKYCGLDTLAMVGIWKKLIRLIK